MRRRSGILLHPTSLPGPYGIGDLGRAAYDFVDFLAGGAQTLWQVLPLGPPGYGNSPYQAFSSMAGSPLLINLDMLVDKGWLEAEDLEESPQSSESRVEFDRVNAFKWPLLRKSARCFLERASEAERRDFDAFCAEKSSWLNSYARFMALKDANGGAAWTEWQRRSDPETSDVLVHKFIQFEFFRQWRSLKQYCTDRGIDIIGDLPIFVAHDSADVWANPQLFDLNGEGRPRTVAGVPPDYFSSTGQLWGNPLYRWDVHAGTDYAWWIARVKATLEMVDLVRLDHFRGFEKYYEIAGGSETAIDGRWVEGPGDPFFAALQKALGGLPMIAEDLGLITPEVEQLRDRWNLPGMRVLQFAFVDDSPDDSFKPHNYIRNCVVYTGTHDNDSTVGWFTAGGSAESTRHPEEVRREREYALRYLHSDGREIHWDFIRAALASVADMAIIPLQDVLGLGSEARMNLPASLGDNWSWRYRRSELREDLGSRLRELTEIYGRGR